MVVAVRVWERVVEEAAGTHESRRALQIRRSMHFTMAVLLNNRIILRGIP